MITRRDFMKASLAAGAGLSLGISPKPHPATARLRAVKDDISIAQWALVDEIHSGMWKTLDFPKIAREVFDINGIEFVNTLFEVPTYDYLKQLKHNADDYGVTMVLIMVDAEGETCTPLKEERKQTVINHRKWIDIAHFLGCHAIRTNCRGDQSAPPEEALEWAADSYFQMLEYSVPAGISLLIENHGGFSNDADWMVKLMEKVNNLYFGTYIDWRRPGAEFDNYAYLQKLLPWAGGMSYRNQPDERLTEKMIALCRESGYRGWYGIESSGRDEIKKGRDILKRVLLNKEK